MLSDSDVLLLCIAGMLTCELLDRIIARREVRRRMEELDAE